MSKRVFPSRAALLSTMGNIVKREVKHYLTDFTEYDKPEIEALDIPEKETALFVWITRECGTYLIPRDHYDSLKMILECYGPANVKTREIFFTHYTCTMENVDAAELLTMAKRELSKAANAA